MGQLHDALACGIRQRSTANEYTSQLIDAAVACGEGQWTNGIELELVILHAPELPQIPQKGGLAKRSLSIARDLQQCPELPKTSL